MAVGGKQNNTLPNRTEIITDSIIEELKSGHENSVAKENTTSNLESIMEIVQL